MLNLIRTIKKKNFYYILFLIVFALIFSHYTLTSFFHMWVSHGIFPAVDYLETNGTFAYFEKYLFEHAWWS